MKKVLLLLAVAAFGLGGCTTKPFSYAGTEFYSVHKKVFGCPPLSPEKYVAPTPKTTAGLNAVGPSECGKPVYKKPSCSECDGDSCRK